MFVKSISVDVRLQIRRIDGVIKLDHFHHDAFLPSCSHKHIQHSENNLSSVSCDKSLTRYQLFYSTPHTEKLQRETHNHIRGGDACLHVPRAPPMCL